MNRSKKIFNFYFKKEFKKHIFFITKNIKSLVIKFEAYYFLTYYFLTHRPWYYLILKNDGKLYFVVVNCNICAEIYKKNKFLLICICSRHLIN